VKQFVPRVFQLAGPWTLAWGHRFPFLLRKRVLGSVMLESQ
jgi:hypothetical protein